MKMELFTPLDVRQYISPSSQDRAKPKPKARWEELKEDILREYPRGRQHMIDWMKENRAFEAK